VMSRYGYKKKSVPVIFEQPCTQMQSDTECLIWGVKASVIVLRVKVQVFLLLFINCVLSRG